MGSFSGAARSAYLLLTLTAGCSSLLGDFTSGTGGGESDTGIGPDAMGSSGGASSGGLFDAGDGATASDGQATNDAPLEATTAPIPNRPGLDTTAGGNTSTSTNYLLIGAVGEGPGANIIVGTSTNYTLKGGVIAGTQ